jgi:gliding motility-associated-like protein
MALLFMFQTAAAQYEWLSILDYVSLDVEQIVNIPDVNYVKTDNTAYDANAGRFFFQGNNNGQLPYKLYTVSTTLNTVLYNPVCPSNMGGEVVGLQYDHSFDTLYGIWLGNPSFCWIDPVTGAVHLKTPIPNYSGYSWSAFDTRDHWYLVSNGNKMLVIDAWREQILFNLSLPNIADLFFDEVTGKLYGIDLSGVTPQFDSITITSGALHPIVNLPSLTLPHFYSYTIDETFDKYIFIGTDSSSGACSMNYLYVIDLVKGTLDYRKPYPYPLAVNSPNQGNLLEFSSINTYDPTEGSKVLALNWDPPPSHVTIVADSELACAVVSVPEKFTATPGTLFVNPSFQWQLNGMNVGSNSTVYTNNSLPPGDTVRCIVTTCYTNTNDTSNIFVINKIVQDTVSISVTSENICTDNNITLAAKTTNAGVSPDYQWIVNGKPAGTDSAVYVMSNPANGDSVVCVITATCIVPGPDTSNLIIFQYASLDPSVTINTLKDSVCAEDTVLFTAVPINAGAAPVYQWQINGINTGTGSDTLMAVNLQSGDMVSCVMNAGIVCSHPFTSNIVSVAIKETPIVFVGNDTVIAPGQMIQLNPYVSGPVSSWQWTPVTYLDNPLIANPTATPAVTTTYRLTVTADDGCQSNGKITITIYSALKMPNAFTPNGDGLNDLFRIPASTTQKIKSFSVFDRWGELVFRTSDSGAGWDGTFNGQKQPTGTYIWQIQYLDLLSSKVEWASGTVELVR